MRLLSGLLFGIGIVWFAYLRLQATFNQTANQIDLNFQQAAANVKIGDIPGKKYGS